GVLEPHFVHARDAVAGAEDQIDEVVAVKRLAEPVRKGELTRVTGLAENFAGALEVFAADEDVEVFRVPLDAGVPRVCVRAADEIFNAFAVETAERVTIKRAA